MLGRICRVGGSKRKLLFSSNRRPRVAAGGAAVVGRIGLLEGRKRENDLFLFLFSFLTRKRFSLADSESHIALAPSQIHALGIIHFALAHGSSSSSQQRWQLVESPQSHVLHKFGANVCGETSEAFCISFPTNTPLPRRSISSILLLLRWWWRRGDITIYNRYILFPRRFAPYTVHPPKTHLCTQLREDIRFSTVFDERASKNKRCGIYSTARIFLRLDFETLRKPKAAPNINILSSQRTVLNWMLRVCII